ncbi:MAG: hypothetical protein J0H19_23710 [Rhodospirillales bacterium]|nr:hypothetical protein [Rhodospirillales bacterium]
MHHSGRTPGEPDSDVRAEALQAARGFTVSTDRAVVGQFRGEYFMRSRTRRITLPVDTTSFVDLLETWRRFRREAQEEEPQVVNG